MDWRIWLGFVSAALLIGIIPGPAVMSIAGYALSSGRKVALASVAGMACGNAFAMTLSLSGVGALLAASAQAFSLVKWAGALYLIGLGLLTLVNSRGRQADNAAPAPPVSARVAFTSNVAIGVFHPKTIVFFVAFVPQFISAKSAYFPQAALLILTFCAVVGVTDTLYALAAANAAHLLRRPGADLWAKRAGGGVLVAAGVPTAAVRK